MSVDRRSIELARQFRREDTPAEALLWEHLRGRGLKGLKFRRQHPLGGCIADFYCAAAALVIEVDGSVHLDPEQREHDGIRDEELRSRGLAVLRFTNDQIEGDIWNVLRTIAAAAKARESDAPVPDSSPPSPRVERGRG